MIKELINLANELDSRGLLKESDYLDLLLRKTAQAELPPEFLEALNKLTEEQKGALGDLLMQGGPISASSTEAGTEAGTEAEDLRHKRQGTGPYEAEYTQHLRDGGSRASYVQGLNDPEYRPRGADPGLQDPLWDDDWTNP